MERAIQQTIDYTRERKAFGKSILDNQYVHFRLAEMESEVEALRSLVYRATGKNFLYNYYIPVRGQINKTTRVDNLVFPQCSGQLFIHLLSLANVKYIQLENSSKMFQCKVYSVLSQCSFKQIYMNR